MNKKHLNTLLIVFVISLFANNLYAQEAYLSINAGYGFNTSSQNLNDYFKFKNTTKITTSTTYEQVNLSLGKGLNVAAAYGYMFNDNVGTELGVSYLLGGKSHAKDQNISGTTDYTLSAKMLRINPSIVIASDFRDINAYAKMGLLIGLGSVIYETNTNNNGDIKIVKLKLNGGLAFGLNAGVGALFNLNKNMSLFGEINMVNMSYAPTKGEITKSTLNGFDQLPSMSKQNKEIEFVDSYTDDPNNPSTFSEPSKELKQKLPFGSVGISIGLRILL